MMRHILMMPVLILLTFSVNYCLPTVYKCLIGGFIGSASALLSW